MLLDEMEIFYYAVEYSSFSKAAERLGVSKSYISKKITKLERDLKVRLISRSTRKLSLSEAGEHFYRYCANVVREGNEAYAMISELKGKPSGILKISVPPALALNLISIILPRYLKHYPEVTLDVQLDNRLVDLIEEGYDLALRSAPALPSSNLIAQKILSIRSVICATNNYLKTHGEPHQASDLEKHNFATYSPSKHAAHIKLIKNHHEETITVKGNFLSNQLELIKQMVLSDVCMALLPEFMVINEIKSGKLMPCLTAYQLTESPLFAVYPEAKFMLPKLKCFLDELKSFLVNSNL